MNWDLYKTPKFWFQNLLTALLYTLGGLIGNMLIVPGTLAAPLWIPSGIALSLVLWCGTHVFWGILFAETLVSALLGDFYSWQNWVESSLLGFGATIQAIFAAQFIEYYAHTKTPFYSVRDILIFIFGADILVSLISCTIGTISMLLFGMIKTNQIVNNWFVWWLGDTVGILAITPLIMTWYKTTISFSWKIALEFTILIVLLIATAFLIYKLEYPLVYLLIPYCVWGAVRFNTRQATLLAFLISISVLCLELEGYEEFHVANLAISLLFLQVFVAVIFFTTLILSALITERKKAQDELYQSNLELESRVQKRTKDLHDKNAQLKVAISNLKQAETQLIQSEKMSSLGILTAGIAHEINNPVNFISANIVPLKNDIHDIVQVLNKYTELSANSPLSEELKEARKLSEELDLPYTLKETYQLLDGIEEGARRTATIVKDLRTFSRLDETDLKSVNIHENLDSTLTLLHNLFRDRINIVKNYGDIPEIACFPGKINQVFMNILTNAANAIPDKGEVTISTSQNKDHVQISIKDTGEGMSKETIKKIFEPFFTTKPVGKGTGLGLSISYSIIQEHHGTISINSSLGKGTEFIITLPIKKHR
jgi:signal transduction histidine kinase